ANRATSPAIGSSGSASKANALRGWRINPLRIFAMRAIRFERPGKVSQMEFPDPEPKAGWARICIRAAAICMTDLELLRGRHTVEYPLTPGHEYCGVVDRVGSPCDGAWVGRKVVADN